MAIPFPHQIRVEAWNLQFKDFCIPFEEAFEQLPMFIMFFSLIFFSPLFFSHVVQVRF
jgi:hypothetical protein